MHGVSALRAASQAPYQEAFSPKLRKATQEFEGILLSMWLEKVQQSFAGTEDSNDAGHQTLESMGTQAISSALATHGGIGFARMLLRQLGKPAEAGAPASK